MRPGTRAGWVTRLDELHLLTPLRVALIVVVALVLTVVVRAAITRVLRRTILVPGTDRTRADARQQALASTLRSAVIGVIWAAAVITVVGEVGVNLSGVVATATVVGGAIAFGAQTLIRDLISGFFVLAEDQYGVGDEVDLGVCRGVVERITLRSVRTRDADGRVWHVTHGNVTTVGNLSQRSTLPLEVEVARPPAGTTVDITPALVTLIADLVHAAPAGLIGQPEVVGLARFTDDRLVYRVRAGVHPNPASHAAVRAAWRDAVLQSFSAGRLTPPA